MESQAENSYAVVLPFREDQEDRQVTGLLFWDGQVITEPFRRSQLGSRPSPASRFFVCENNGYGISVSQKQHQTIQDISIRAAAYNMPGITVDGNERVSRLRDIRQGHPAGKGRGRGPPWSNARPTDGGGTTRETRTRAERYRTMEEIQEWVKKCPIRRFEGKLVSKKTLTKLQGPRRSGKEVEKEIDGAVNLQTRAHSRNPRISMKMSMLKEEAPMRELITPGY